jgi:predicted transcriptional regulator
MQRGTVDAVASILRLTRTNNGLSKKKLQEELDLPVVLLNHYLSTMVSKNLVEIVNEKGKRKGADKIIRITDRGIKFLELYDTIRTKYLTLESELK